MLITLECVLLALQAVAAVRIPLDSPFEITSPSNSRLSKRSPVQLGGGIRKCFRIGLNVNGIDLNLQVDSGVSDMIVPLPSSSSSVGLTSKSTLNEEGIMIEYKNEEYNAFSSTADVTIPGTKIIDMDLPVLAVQKQSPDLIGIGGRIDQGLFGFAYSSLSKRHPQSTAMDVLYNSGIIPKNEIGLQICPYGMLSESFINIGNTGVTPKCGTDGTSVAWVQSPSADHHTVNIKSILINGELVDLPAGFQKKVENGRTLYSYLQTCFLYMRFPKVVVDVLINTILDSDAITVKTMFRNDYLGKRKIKRKLRENHLMSESKYNIDWDMMPTVSIVMYSETPVTDENRDSVVKIELSPRDYMWRYDSKHVRFAVAVGSNDYATLGTSFMVRLGLTFDLQNTRIGFGPGCGCEIITDGYPIISNGDRVLWSPSHVRLPEQPSTSSSGDTSTLRRSLSRLGSTLRGSTRRGNKHSKVSYEKLEG
ncbi:hypothetical protein O5D80_006353 [Batrachochytrium dendrobatidis]|nr:hypothetical protein O5D80_006353 [Batrachochytrium dendrobatidis]